MTTTKTLQFACICLSFFFFFSCKENNTVVDPNPNKDPDVEEEFDPSTVMSLREILEEYYADDYFFIGAAANMGFFNEENMVNSINRRYVSEFSYNTPANDFKQEQTNPKPESTWKSSGYMAQIEAARKYGMVIRAHGPISPQCSPWARDDSRTAEELENMLRVFMTNLSKDLEKNKDIVHWMDVVNETFTQSQQGNGIGYDGKQTGITYQPDDWFGPRKGNNTWENPWPLIGFETLTCNGESFQVPKYIRMAFEIANEHAPSIKKIYNEHGGAINVSAWEKIKKTILALRESGTRVDGVGWQAHVSVGWENVPGNVENLQEIITWCYENDLEFHITELDVAITNYGQDQSINYALLEATRNEQAATVSSILNLMLKNMGKGACGINFWRLTDSFGDGRTIAALFNQDAEPNEIFYRIKNTLVDFKTDKK